MVFRSWNRYTIVGIGIVCLVSLTGCSDWSHGNGSETGQTTTYETQNVQTVVNSSDNTMDYTSPPLSTPDTNSTPTVHIITMSEFQQIGSFYTVDMVNQLFGFNGTLDSDVGAGTGYELTMYHWEDDAGDIITVQFQNGREDAKDQIGLQ